MPTTSGRFTTQNQNSAGVTGACDSAGQCLGHQQLQKQHQHIAAKAGAAEEAAEAEAAAETAAEAAAAPTAVAAENFVGSRSKQEQR